MSGAGQLRKANSCAVPRPPPGAPQEGTHPMTSFRRTAQRSAALAVTAAAALAVTLVQNPAQADNDKPARTVDVRLIGINDLHGNIEPPSGSSGRVTLSDGTQVEAG